VERDEVVEVAGKEGRWCAVEAVSSVALGACGSAGCRLRRQSKGSRPQNPPMDYSYSAAKRRSHDILWPIFARVLILRPYHLLMKD